MKEILKFMKEFFKAKKGLISTTVFFEAFYSILETIAIPLLVAGAFNHIKDAEYFKEQLIKLVLVWITIKITFSISLHLHNKLEPEIGKFITINIFKNVFKKHEKDNKIDNVTLLIDKIQLIKANLHEFSYLVFTIFAPRIITIILNCIAIIKVNKKMGIILTLSVFVQLSILSKGLGKCINTTLDEIAIKTNLYNYIEDVIQNINIVKSTTTGYEYEINKINEIAEEVKKSEINVSKCINSKQFLGYGVNVVLFCMIIYTLYYLYKNGEMSSEDTTTSVLLIIGLTTNMSDLAYYIPSLTYKLGILQSNEDFLKELAIYDEPSHNISRGFPSLSPTNYKIEFKNVSFNYKTVTPKGAESPTIILNNFSIVLPQNDIITIYGGIGQGKSTFVKLIFGILKPTQGEVIIGGQNIATYDITETRKYISYVDQNSNQLFNRTVLDNITYGTSEAVATLENIKNIINKFNLYEVFKNLDKNKDKWSFLNINSGKMGEKLSGGQKQLIHLLRISLNNFAKIVILDEPTSHLDPSTRDKVLVMIRHINSQGKTVLIISHDNNLKKFGNKILQFYSNKNPEYVRIG